MCRFRDLVCSIATESEARALLKGWQALLTWQKGKTEVEDGETGNQTEDKEFFDFYALLL